MKGLFGKYIIVTVSLLLVSFGMFGAGFLWQTYNYTLGESQSMLKDNADYIAKQTAIWVENSSTVFEPMLKNSFLLSVSRITHEPDANVIVTDVNGNLSLYADQDGIRQGSDEAISETVMSKLMETGQYQGIGDLEGAFSSVYYTCGASIVGSDGSILGAVFVSSPASSALQALQDLQRMFLLTGALVLFIAFIVSYFIAQNMSKPLKNMSKAARAVARGDFSIQVPENRNDEIGELAHSFNHMSTSLGNLEELRSSFVANVSHELKTPMTTIAGFIDGILDGTIPADREKEYLTLISNDIHRLSRLVLRMLEASRIQSGQTQIHPVTVDICETMRRVLLGFEQIITNKKISVDAFFDDEVITVKADPDSIVQVIFNLIDNACKFTPNEGEIRISVTKSGSKASVSVANTGQEIPPNILPYVFDRFYKADQSRGNDKNGAGLGLFIVKSIVNMHGEDITAMSENGVTTFRFLLPLVD